MIHPVLSAAADGDLPAWAEASPRRRAHMARVADLMGTWSNAFVATPADTVRWRAAGMLHDALRDADPLSLEPLVAPDLGRLPGPLLHGPAAAARLRADGVSDEPLLFAVAWHTTGHPDLDTMGRALYMADYLDPGRHTAPADAEARRAGVPTDLTGTLEAVVGARIGHALDGRQPLLDPTVRFWNSLVHA